MTLSEVVQWYVSFTMEQTVGICQFLCLLDVIVRKKKMLLYVRLLHRTVEIIHSLWLQLLRTGNGVHWRWIPSDPKCLSPPLW